MPALLVGAPTGGLVGVDVDLDAMAAVAPSLGLGAPIVESAATVAIVRRRLAELLACTGRGDRVLLYLTGHGGFVENTAHDPRAARPAPQRLHYFVATPDPGAREQLLFDVELSLWLARLARRTANVTVVVDACFSAGLVRDGLTTEDLLADFAAWRAEHQDEIDELHAEAHPDVVRLAAAGVHGFARPGTDGSALTQALLAALAEPGARRSSWLALFTQIERRLARAGVAQQPRISGPVRRRVFELATTLPPGAYPVHAADAGLVLAGGARQGVATGDLFLVTDAAGEQLCQADLVDLDTTVLRRLDARAAPLAISPECFARPLRLRGHGGVVVTGDDEARSAVERALRAAHRDLCSPQRASQALAAVHCSADRIELRAADGLVAQVTTSAQCIEALRGFARAARLQTLGGVPLAALGLRVAWGRVRDGACEPLSGPAIELTAGDPIHVRVENIGDQRRFVGVYWLADDGAGVQLSRSEAMGVELMPRSTYLLGDRPFARRPRGVPLPRRPLAPGERRHERLVVVATAQRQSLWSFDAGPDGRRTGELVGVEILHFTVTPEPEP